MDSVLWLVLALNVALLVALAVAAVVVHKSWSRNPRIPLDPDLRSRVLSLEQRVERLESRRL